MSNQGIRITIDGACNSGKTILMQAFAAFLQQHGISAENITQLNDTTPEARLSGQDAINMLTIVTQSKKWDDTKFVFVERMVPKHALNENDGDWNAMPDLSNHPIPETPAFSLPRSQIAFEMTNYHVPFSGKLHGHDSSTPLYDKTAHATLTENCRTAAKDLGISDQVLDTDCFSTTAALATKHAPSIESLTSGRPVSDMPGDGKSLGDMFAGRREAKHANDGHSGAVLGHPGKYPRGMNPYITHIDDAGLWPDGIAPQQAAPVMTTVRVLMGDDTWLDMQLQRDHSKFDEFLQRLRDCGYVVSSTKHMEIALERTRARILNPESVPARLSGITDDSKQRSNLDVTQREGHNGVNLTKIQDIGPNGASYLPPSGE
jgi:hypothetical protein